MRARALPDSMVQELLGGIYKHSTGRTGCRGAIIASLLAVIAWGLSLSGPVDRHGSGRVFEWPIRCWYVSCSLAVGTTGLIHQLGKARSCVGGRWCRWVIYHDHVRLTAGYSENFTCYKLWAAGGIACPTMVRGLNLHGALRRC
jgi:hypothetical protein